MLYCSYLTRGEERMEEASSLLPADMMNELLLLLREFRLSNAHGHIQLSIQHGHLSGVGAYKNKRYPFVDKDCKNKS